MALTIAANGYAVLRLFCAVGICFGASAPAAAAPQLPLRTALRRVPNVERSGAGSYAVYQQLSIRVRRTLRRVGEQILDFGART